MIIRQRVLPNARLGNDVGIWRVPLSMRSCILCLMRK